MIVLQWATFAVSSPSSPLHFGVLSAPISPQLLSRLLSPLPNLLGFLIDMPSAVLSLSILASTAYIERLWLSPVCMCNFHPSVHILYLLLLALLPIFLLLRLAPSIEHCQTYSRVNKVSLDREKGNRRGVTPQPSLQQMEPISQIRDRPSIHTNQAWCVCVCL